MTGSLRKGLSTWTEAEKEIVIQHWGKLTARAGMLTDKTRNAVIGMAHRMQLGGATTHQIRKAKKPAPALELVLGGVSSPEMAKKTANKPPKPKPNKVPKPPSQPKERPVLHAVPRAPIPMVELKPFHCRAIVGYDEHKIATYCGHQVFPGKSWCEGHCAKYFDYTKRRAG